MDKELALQPIFLLGKSQETKGEINRKSGLINSALHGIVWVLITFVWGEEMEVIWGGPQPSSISKKSILGQNHSIEVLGYIVSISGSSEYVKTGCYELSWFAYSTGTAIIVIKIIILLILKTLKLSKTLNVHCGMHSWLYLNNTITW